MRVNFLESLRLINSKGKMDLVQRGDQIVPHNPNYWGIIESKRLQERENQKIAQILDGVPYIVSEIYTKLKSDVPYFELGNTKGEKVLAPASLFKKLV